MLRTLTIILTAVFCLQIQAATTSQDTLTLSATVVDEMQAPLPYATVLLITEEGEILKTTTTDQKGKFNIDREGNEGKFVAVRFVGYKQGWVPIPLPAVIQLQPKSNILNEVVVKGKRAVYKVSEGAFEIDVQKSGLNNMPNVVDVLAFLPGILSAGGTPIPIAGGTPLYILNGIEQKSYDRISALRPEQIKTVSVNYYPSAKYSANYGCIISVTTKKQLKDYLSVILDHSSILGRRYTEGDCLKFFLSKKKWDNFLSYNVSCLREDNTATNRYYIYNQQGEEERISTSVNNHKYSKPAHHFIESFNYRPTKKFDITFQTDFKTSTKKAKMWGDESNKEIGQDEIKSWTSQDRRDNSTSVNADLLMNYKFTDQHELSVSGGYVYLKSKSDYDLDSDSNISSTIKGKNRFNAFNAKIEYNGKFLKDLNLLTINTGIYGSSILNKGYSNFEASDAETKLPNTLSDIRDDELSFFSTINYNRNKLFVSAGARASIFRSKYYESELGEGYNSKSYFKIIPRITAQWQMNNDWQAIGSFINLNSRPMFRDISPLFNYLNPYLYVQGNPSLKANDRYIYSLAMVWKNTVAMQARFIHDANAVNWIYKLCPELNNSPLLNTPVNTDYNTWLFNISYSDKIGIYTFAYNAFYRYIPTKYKYLDAYAPRNPKLTVNMANRFDITKKTLAAIDFHYYSKNGFLGVLEEPAYGLSMWIRQYFFKDNRLEVVLRGQDLLHKAIVPKYTVTLDNIKVQSIPNYDSRCLLLSLVYRFNGIKKTFKRMNTNEDNQKRMNL